MATLLTPTAPSIISYTSSARTNTYKEKIIWDGREIRKSGDIQIKLIKLHSMLTKRYYYNESISICSEDKLYVRSLKRGKFGKKSLAGVLSFIIADFKERHKDGIVTCG